MWRTTPSCQPTPGLASRIYQLVQPLNPREQWLIFRALAWIAGASQELGVAELLSAVTADCQFSLPKHQHHVSRHETDPEQLQRLLIRTEIISAPPGTVLDRKYATALLQTITGRPSSEKSWIHASLAITCLRCIESYQPEAVFHTLEQHTSATNGTTARNFNNDQTSTKRPPIADWPSCRSTVSHFPLLFDILPYALSNWHAHFKLAEQSSWRQSALVHQIIKIALAENQFVCHDNGSNVMNVGLLLCALHEFTALARTYLEMGASFDAVLNPWGTSPLHVAASCGSCGVLALGLIRQPDLSSLDHTGLTALQNAILQEQSSTVEMLRMAEAAISPSWNWKGRAQDMAQETDPEILMGQTVQYAQSCSRYRLDGSSQIQILIRCFQDDLTICPGVVGVGSRLNCVQQACGPRTAYHNCVNDIVD